MFVGMARPQSLLILLSTSSPYRITQTSWMREPPTKNSDVDYFVPSFYFDFLNKSNHCQKTKDNSIVMAKLCRKVELHINPANFLNIFPLPRYNTSNYYHTNILNIVHCASWEIIGELYRCNYGCCCEPGGVYLVE